MADKPNYNELFAKLSDEQLQILARALSAENLVTIGEEPVTVASLAAACADMDLVDVVLPVSAHEDPSIMEVLMAKEVSKAPTAPPRTKRDKSSKEPRAKGGATTKVTVSDDRVILSVKPNPKKPDSKAFGRYALYKVGMTVSEFYKAGGTKGDVQWDGDREFITLGEPGSKPGEEPMAAAAE